jgi:DNA-binding NarL/FixJ family response regulator
MIKILHLDDDLSHHELTKVQLSRLSDDIVLDHANSYQAALSALKDDVYDGILTDDQLRENDGLELLKTLRTNGHLIPFVILSEISDEGNKSVRERAYFDDEFHVIVNFFHFDLLSFWIYRLVDTYRKFLREDKLGRDLFQTSPEKKESLQRAIKTLTVRETEILDLIAAGKSNKEIAEALFISYKTVKNHVYSVFAKLGIHTRAEAIHLAIGQKLAKERNSVFS